MNKTPKVKVNVSKKNLREFSDQEIEGFLGDDKLSLEDSRRLLRLLELKNKNEKSK